MGAKLSAVGWIIGIFIVLWLTNRSARDAKTKGADGHRRTGHPLPQPPLQPKKAKMQKDTFPTKAEREPEPPAKYYQTRLSESRGSPESGSISSTRPLSDLVTVELTIEGRTSRNVPLPVRRQRRRDIDVGNGTTFSAELNAFEFEFVDLAERNVSRVGKPTEHVPFKAYWSSYSDMDESQSSWYYFWRSEVRSGRYPPTDLSYIFIHVYECLHGIGFDTILHSYGHLWALWHNYRLQHPRLDNYLMGWMLDLNAYYGIGLNPLEIVRSSTGAATSGISPDLLTAALLDSETEYIPTIDQIAKIAKYDPRSGKFYKEFSDKELIDRTLVLGFQALDGYYRETSRVGVIKAHDPERKVKVNHLAFAGAVFNYQSKHLLIAEVGAYSSLVTLPKLVEDTLKLSENILRKQVSFAGQRRGIELPPAIVERIRAVLGDAGARPVEVRHERRSLIIDSSLAESLNAESRDIRAALIASMESSSPAVAHSARFELPSDRSPNELTDVDSVASVFDKLSATELGLIRSMRSTNWELATSEPHVLDDVNRYALMEIGEPLLVVEGSRLLVVDDYRDELGFLLDHPDYARLSTPKPEEPGSEVAGWRSLRNAMTTLQVAAMHLILEGVTSAEFDAFAVEHGAMSSLILDEINDLALANLSDTLVFIDDGNVSVFDEYLGDARRSLEAKGD